MKKSVDFYVFLLHNVKRMKKLYLSLLSLSALGALQAAALSPYIDRVYEYCPAPGQFVNTMPRWEKGLTAADMATLCEAQIAADKGGMICLGAYGGYVVFGFDHPVQNVPGEYDFLVTGNAFFQTEMDAPRPGGSCEPGIVMVSVDANANGLPDDPWYELAGSEYSAEATIHNYQITYYRPESATPASDETYIRWTDNQGNSGYVEKNPFHSQSYWPEWLADRETLSFSGARLADNYEDLSGQGSGYILYPYAWGYVDNMPKAQDPGLKIDWAVDGEGNPVALDHIDFVKVYTAVNQSCGWLGETSTEISGAIDLHTPDGIGFVTTDNAAPRIMWCSGVLTLTSVARDTRVAVFSAAGALVDSFSATGEVIENRALALTPGIYVVTAGTHTVKIAVR